MQRDDSTKDWAGDIVARVAEDALLARKTGAGDAKDRNLSVSRCVGRSLAEVKRNEMTDKIALVV